MEVLLWILAIIIGVPALLLFILLILAVIPLRYRVTAGTEGEETSVRVAASYLLRLLYITFTYSGKKTDVSVRVAGFKLNLREAGQEPGKESVKKSKKEKKRKLTKVKKSKREKVKQEPEKKGIKETLGGIKAVLTRKDLKIIIALLFEYVIKTVKYLLPKRFEVIGIIGLDDPYKTGVFVGMTEAVVSALNRRQNIRVAGDFNRKRIFLNADIRGRVSAAGILAPLLWLVSRKPIFKLILEYFDKARKNKRKEG